MKAREDRYNVLIPARMRWDGRWAAASVRNVSTRGLMVRTALPPSPGTYVELQLGAGVITARSVWAAEQSCGLWSRERIDVAALRGTRRPGQTQAAPAAAPVRPKRALSLAEQAERSRRLSSLMQYLLFAGIAIAVAATLAHEVYRTLAAPLSAVERELG